MTVVYKKIQPGQRTGNEVLIATNKKTNRLLFHHRISSTGKEDKFKFPIEIFLDNQEVEIHHDLMDPQIAICSTTALPLFSDNFDYDTRDQFIRGLVMNQELQAASIYVQQLPNDQYAAKVSDWMSYHTVSQDIINRWVYPLVPDMGICSLKQQYLFLKDNIYRNNSVKVQRNSALKNDVVVQSECYIDENSILSRCVIGKNCKIGRNCRISNAYIFDNTVISDSCEIINSIIGANVHVQAGCEIYDGCVIGNDCLILRDTILKETIVQSTMMQDDEFATDQFEKLNERAFKLKEDCENKNNDDSEDDIDEDEQESKNCIVKLLPQKANYESSAYSSRTGSEDESDEEQIIKDDSHLFLTEVLDSLKRGFEEKSNPDFLILEINSSRYAYNMQLNEVNFFVVKASLTLPIVVESVDPIDGFKQVYTYLGENVFKNYIKGNSAMVDCLNAIIECCEENEKIKLKLVKILHFLYNEDILSDDVIVSWYEDIDVDWVKKSLAKFIEWLEQESEEESDE
jgi:translation initiation factor eIF-2B subunit epsilon